jgi:hypothetical protein
MAVRFRGFGDDGSSKYGASTGITTNVVPIPAAGYLLGTALLGMAGIARKRKQ